MKTLPVQIGPLQLELELDEPCRRTFERCMDGFVSTETLSSRRHVTLISALSYRQQAGPPTVAEQSFRLYHHATHSTVVYEPREEHATENPATVGFLHALSLLALEHDSLLVHASAVVDQGHAWVFLGRSGAGKSTIASFFPPTDVLNDDFVLLSAGPEARVYSQPFFGKSMSERTTRFREAPIRAAVTLSHGVHPADHPLNKRALLLALMNSAGLPRTAQQFQGAALERAARLTEALSGIALTFPRAQEPTREYLTTLINRRMAYTPEPDRMGRK
ncbi:MAG: hypothetical protein AAF658_03170 [Myxococcota bacterium]